MGITYNIPDTSLLALISVRPLFLWVFYTTDNLFLFQGPAVWFEA
jgi:hypothetical protein